MNYLRRLEPTPSALKQGRILGVVIVAIFVFIVAIYIGSGLPWDTGMIVSTSATGFSFIGDAIAYTGQPSLTRYRLGLAIIVIGATVAFASLLIWPLPV
jgi:hypothetical protein